MNLNRPQRLICGIDEVGRGCVAGPLFAVAALFKGWIIGCPGVEDSKKLTEKKRAKLFKMILRCPDLVDFRVGISSVEEINTRGIEYANIIAFQRAVNSLKVRPHYLVVDGLKGVPGWGADEQLVVPRADAEYEVTGAASILAKHIRDSYMIEMDKFYPGYLLPKNKGYGSPKHCEALRTLGPTEIHRIQFISKIMDSQLEFAV